VPLKTVGIGQRIPSHGHVAKGSDDSGGRKRGEKERRKGEENEREREGVAPFVIERFSSPFLLIAV
jgi:hypothetical protein